jgi:hypothetical protein
MESKDYITINLQYFQNIITISSALLLLVPTLLEKIFKTHHWRYSAYIAIGGFIVAVLGSVGSQVGLSYITSGIYSGQVTIVVIGTNITRVFQTVMWVGFISGIIALAIFIFRNIFREKK